jgi:hypothetical protein
MLMAKILRFLSSWFREQRQMPRKGGELCHWKIRPVSTLVDLNMADGEGHETWKGNL